MANIGSLTGRITPAQMIVFCEYGNCSEIEIDGESRTLCGITVIGHVSRSL